MIFEREAFNRSFEHVTSFAHSKMKLFPEIQKKGESKGTRCNASVVYDSALISKRLRFYTSLNDTYTMVEDPIPKKPSAALDWVGITVFIVGFFLAVGSIRFTGWFVPTNLERAYSICGASLLVGSIPIVWNHMLKEKYSKAFEVHNGKKKWKLWQILLFFVAIDLVILIFATIL